MGRGNPKDLAKTYRSKRGKKKKIGRGSPMNEMGRGSPMNGMGWHSKNVA